jgi:hypothetical protein
VDFAEENGFQLNSQIMTGLDQAPSGFLKLNFKVLPVKLVFSSSAVHLAENTDE